MSSIRRVVAPSSVRSWLVGLAVVLCVLLGAGEARADGILHNAFGIPRAEDGRGLKVGERATFHSGFALGVGVDTNVYSNARSESKTRAAFLWPTAWLGIGNREIRDGLLMSPPERSGRILDYNISALAGFRPYVARDPIVRSVPRFSIGAQARLTLLPGRRFSTQLDYDFFVGAAPANFKVDGGVLNFNRLDGRGQLTFYLRPGGGRLQFGLGYRNQILFFLDGALYKNNRIVNGLYHETKWRFLPRSSVLVTYTLDFSYYNQCCQEIGIGRKEDNWAHRLLAGYRGQVVDKLALEAMAGWGAGFYRQDASGGPDFNSFIGNVSVSYFPTMRSLVYLSVFRTFQDSLFGNFYVDNGAMVALQHQFRWRMIAHLGGSVAARRIKGLPVPLFDPTGDGYPEPLRENESIDHYEGRGANRQERHTTIVGLSAKLEQPLGKIFALSLGYNLLIDSRPYRVFYVSEPTMDEPNPDPYVDDLSFMRHLVMLVAAVRI